MDIDIFEAQSLSRKLDKNIFVFYYEKDCTFCNRAEDSLFSNIEVKKFLDQDYVSVKANFANGIYSSWFEKYEVTCLPTFQIIDPEGELLVDIKGLVDPMKLIKILEESTKNQIATKNLTAETIFEKNDFKDGIEASDQILYHTVGCVYLLGKCFRI